MTKVLRVLITAISAMSASACAGTLSVQVDVLDNAYLETLNAQDDLWSDARDLANGNFEDTGRFLEAAENAVINAGTTNCYTAVETYAKDLTDVATQSKILNTISGLKNRKRPSGPLKEGLEYMSKTLIENDRILSRQINSFYPTFARETDRSKPLPQYVIDRVGSQRAYRARAAEHRDNLVKHAANNCLDLFRTTYEGNAFGIDPISFTQIERNLDYQTSIIMERSVLGGGALLSNRTGAYHVAKAPEKHWATGFNRAMGDGKWGSTATAIKINGLADYTVKGFTFDGNATADMMRKLTVPTVGFAAAMAGIPVNISNAGTNDLVFDDTLISGAQTALAEKQAKDAAYKNALKSIANVVLVYRKELEANARTPLKDSAEAIVKNNFEANKALIAD